MKTLLRRSFRSPGFSIPVLLLMAIAVLVNASVFAVIYAMVWKPLPYRDADHLVELRIDIRNIGKQVALSDTLYRRVREEKSAFVGAVGSISMEENTVDADGRPWHVQRITTGFLDVLGVAPALGRSFVGEASEAARTILISDHAWHAWLGANSHVLGSTLRLKKVDYTVVGVMPPQFSYPDAGIDAWVPFVPTALESKQELVGGFGQFQVVARTAQGVSLGQARAALSRIFDASSSLSRLRASGARLGADARPLRERYSSDYLNSLALMQVAAVLLLIVIASNLAYLVMVRLDARHHEFGVCRALGARRHHLLRLILGDVMPPALAGMLLGIALAPVGVRVIGAIGMIPKSLPSEVGVDLAVAVVAMAAAVVCVVIVLISAVPVLRRRVEMKGLRERGGASGIGKARAAMLVAQVALTTVMLGVGMLLSRSALNLVGENLGFDPTHVVVTSVSLSEMQKNAGLSADAVAAIGERIRRRMAAHVGVVAAEASNSPPFSGASFLVKARARDGSDVETRNYEVTPGYFNAMGIPLLRGQLDALAGDGAVVVDERFAEHVMGEDDPIGAIVRISQGDGKGYREARVVGVVPVTKHQALDEQNGSGALYDLSTRTDSDFFVVSLVSGDPAALAEPLAREVRDTVPEAVVASSRPLRKAVDATMDTRWAVLKLIGMFSGVTLLLAALGLHAALSLNIRRRTSEIGVRMALGATASNILRMVMVQGGRLILAGTVLGVLLGVLFAHSLVDWLYRLQSYDAGAWALACLSVLLPAALACWLPARRATRVEPRTALMAE